MAYKIYVSPSSQQGNIYSAGNTNEEVQMNRVADILCPELTRHGIEWKRNNPANTYAGHVIESNLYDPDYHLAIHTNAGGGHGCTSFCFHPLINNLGTQFATKLYNQIVLISPWPGRGVAATTMDEVEKTNAPACLIEIEFHDNAEGANWIITHIPEIALALLRGILEQLGIPYIPPIDYKALYEITKAELDLAKKKILEQSQEISGLKNQLAVTEATLAAVTATDAAKLKELIDVAKALDLLKSVQDKY